jgi:hypothetical protein
MAFRERTGIGDRPPRKARLFKFPSVERWGIVITVKGVHQGNVDIDWRIGLCGTGFFWRTGTTGGPTASSPDT